MGHRLDAVEAQELGRAVGSPGGFRKGRSDAEDLDVAAFP
jgi:hypothetical protein